MTKFIDLHCDTLTTALETNQSLYQNNLHIDIKRLCKYPKSIQFFAIWLKKDLYKNAYNETKNIIKFFNKEIENNKQYILKAKSFKDILINQQQNKISAILSIEGGESLEGNLENLYKFYKDGVRILTLCWNYENELGYGVRTNSKKGLKPFGKEVVKEMNKIGIIVDVSHLNEEGFWDVYNISEKPFIATHSNSFSVCQNSRNLKDEQIIAIKKKNGIIGLNFYRPFLTDENQANFTHILNHIEHISNLIGFDNISIGGDLDGIDETPIDLEEVSKYEYLFEKIKEKYGLDIAEKIFFNNCYKFIENNL